MKRFAVAGIILATIALSGCEVPSDLETVKELAEARELCDQSGGKFEQWRNGYGQERWRCDFSVEVDQ